MSFVGTKKKTSRAADENSRAERHQQREIRHQVRQLTAPEMPASDGHAE